AAAAAGRAVGARARSGPAAGRRVHPLRPAGWIPQDHAVDAERARSRAACVSAGRLRARRTPRAQELRKGPRGRNVGSRSLLGGLLALAAVPLVTVASAQAPTVDVAARALQPGELVVVSIDATDAADRVAIRAFDRTIPAYRADGGRWRALI